MKKIIVISFILLVCVIGFVAGYFYVNYSTEKNANANIIARVNGEEITLDEIENLYDMYHVHVNISTPSVDKVQVEYAKILYTKIKQILVAQELKKRGIQISDNEINELENVILGDDAKKKDDNFEKDFLQAYGIDYSEWKKQLRPQVENEKLKEILLKEVNISSEETMQYAELLEKKYKEENEEFEFFKIIANLELLKEIKQEKAFSREKLVNKEFSIEEFVALYEEKGATVFQSLFDGESLPQEYKSVLKTMEEKSYSDIITKDNKSYLLYLIKKNKTQKGDGAVDLYLLAEEKLLQNKLPEIYTHWLEQAMKEAKIYIIDSFNPKNVYKNNDSSKIQNLKEALQDLDADLKKLP